MTRPSWDEYFMSIARVVATRAPCVRRQVGAVLVSEDKAILATGYNGPPRGAPHRDESTCVRVGLKSGERADVVCCAHAESNAIAQAARHGVPVKGATLYVTTSPCAWCARSIINAGIVRVVAAEPYADEHAVRVFAESAVDVETLGVARMTHFRAEPKTVHVTQECEPIPFGRVPFTADRPLPVFPSFVCGKPTACGDVHPQYACDRVCFRDAGHEGACSCR